MISEIIKLFKNEIKAEDIKDFVGFSLSDPNPIEYIFVVINKPITFSLKPIIDYENESHTFAIFKTSSLTTIIATWKEKLSRAELIRVMLYYYKKDPHNRLKPMFFKDELPENYEEIIREIYKGEEK